MPPPPGANLFEVIAVLLVSSWHLQSPWVKTFAPGLMSRTASFVLPALVAYAGSTRVAWSLLLPGLEMSVVPYVSLFPTWHLSMMSLVLVNRPSTASEVAPP